MSVELDINELVVEETAAVDVELLRTALAQELGRLLDGAGPRHRSEVAAIDAGVVPAGRGGSAELGRTLARSIHASVWRC